MFWGKKDSYEKNNLFSYAVIDFANFAHCDLGSLLTIIKAHLRDEHEIFAVVNNHNNYVNIKLKPVIPLLCRHFVFVLFSDSSTDTEIIKLTLNRAKRGPVLLATNDFGIINAITEQLTPKEVGFLVNSDSASKDLYQVYKKGYKLLDKNIITWQEGIIKRILRLNDDRIKRAKGYIVKDEIKRVIFHYLPIQMGELFNKLSSSGMVRDKEHLINILTSMAIRKEIILMNHDEIDKIQIRLAQKKTDEEYALKEP
jgi:hypothetical protein